MREVKNMLLFKILAYTIHGAKTINLKYHVQRGIINLNYLMENILYQIFKIIFSISSKNMKQ